MTDDSNDRIALSRLYAGDLSADEATALRRRIEREPGLAKTWRAMGSLLEDLDHLPEESPPESLDDRVLSARLHPETGPVAELDASAPDPSPTWSPWSGAWLVAAALLVALALPALLPFGTAPSTSTLLEGRELIEGQAQLATPAGRVQIDGVALIDVSEVVDVEPAEGSMRRDPTNPTASEVSMNPTHLLSAAAGAALTVTVIEGKAWIWPDEDAPPVEVTAGETHRTGPPPHRVAKHPPKTVDKPAAAAKLDPEVAAWVEQLEAENAALRFENTLVKGQLDAHQGVPLEWPADLAEPATPEAFTAHAEAVAAAVPNLDLHEVRCEEYPCIAVFTGAGLEDELKNDIADLSTALKDRIPEDQGVSTLVSAGISKDSDDPDADSALTIGVAAMDTRGEEPSDAEHDRIQQRMRGIEDELEGGPPR